MIKTMLGLPDYTPWEWLKSLAVFTIFVALFLLGGVFGA